MSDMVIGFDGRHRFLSNFYPCRIVVDGVAYPSVEHAFAAAKTLDPAIRAAIAAAPTAAIAKRMGRGVPLRPGWDDMRIDVMLSLLRLKFKSDPLRRWLISTGDAHLIEANAWGDTFWGACNESGENYLGLLLEKVRSEVQ